VKELSQLRLTNESTHAADATSRLHVPVTVAANGANFLVIEAAEVTDTSGAK